MAALVAGTSFLTACETPAPRQVPKLHWEAVDGSHANGTMKLSARARSGISFRWNDEQATQVATQRCQAWDYRGAELFGKTKKDCVKLIQGTDSCALWEYTRNYQCTKRAATSEEADDGNPGDQDSGGGSYEFNAG